MSNDKFNWYESHENITRLGGWLLHEYLLPSDDPAAGLQYFYEKPWKYTKEWDLMNEEIANQKKQGEK